MDPTQDWAQEAMNPGPAKPPTHPSSAAFPLPELGPLERRYNMYPPSLLPWREDGFKGGPELVVQDSEGRRRPLNEGDYGRKLVATSDAGDSEGASSVISIHDLGFGAASINTYGRDEGDHLDLLPKPGSSVQKSIQEKIEQSLDRSQMDGLQYLPIDAFDAIFCTESIQSLVKETFSEATDEELRAKIAQIAINEERKGRRRILGILTFMRHPEYIDHFIQEDIWDDDLPLRQAETSIRACHTSCTRAGATSYTNTTLLQRWGEE